MTADIVFLNGQVLTMDARNRIQQAVAVKGNRIAAVGSDETIKDLIGSETEVIDLLGNSLLPGFIDSHLHVIDFATDKLQVSCKEAHITSNADIINDLKLKAEKTPQGEWVRAWGYNETKVSEQRYLTKEELDQISTEHPILVMRTCGHISIANSMALERAGIHKGTPDPEGGKIEKDRNGELTGVLIEAANMHMGEIASFSRAATLKAMGLASADYVAAGITSVHEAGAMSSDYIRILHEAVENGSLKVRVYAMLSTLNHSEQFVEKVIDAGIVSGIGNERFKLGPAKVFIDGSSSGPTLATREPYLSDPNNSGILFVDQDTLHETLGRAHAEGFQITAHAQGDRAIEMMLNCIEAALEKHPRDNHRHRIEHAGLTMPDLLERMKQLKVIPVPNPPFFYEFGDGYLENYGDRIDHMYPARDFLDHGMIVAAGSDSPVTDYRPLLGIHVAVNRISESGREVGTRQNIDVLEAIRLYTWNGAYASFEEDIKGSIEVGKLADLVVLNDAILDVPHDRIKDIQVMRTIIDGETVFQK